MPLSALTPTLVATAGNWQQWILPVVLVVFCLPIVVHALTHPAFLRRRVHVLVFAEPEPRQRVIIALLLLCWIGLMLLSVLDLRHGWSSVPAVFTIFGDVCVAGGLLLIYLTFRANQFAGSTVNVEAGQTVISTGPYARIRHPMYSGMLLLMLGMPPAIGSWWGLTVFIPLLAIFAWRLTDEEAYLAKRLPGYDDYLARVRYRLIPRVW